MYWYKRLAASAFYARGHNYYFRARKRRWWRSVEESHAIKKRRKLRRFLAEGGPSAAVTPVMLVQGGTNQIGQRFFEMPGMPNGVLGVFTGEVVQTLGGAWIWTGYSWESYIYPG